MAYRKLTRHRSALLGLLEAWARWRLGSHGYPATSPLHRAGLLMPKGPNKPRSRPPGRADAAADVLALQGMMATVAALDADKAAAMEAVQAAYLGTGTLRDRAAALGLSLPVFKQRRELGLQLLESLLVWSLARDTV